MMKCLSETYLKKVKHFEQLPSLPQPRLFQKDDSGEYVSNIDEVENEN